MKKCLGLLLLLCVNNGVFAMKHAPTLGMLAGAASIARGRALVRAGVDVDVQTEEVAHDDKSGAYTNLEEVAFFAASYVCRIKKAVVVFHKRDLLLLNSRLINENLNLAVCGCLEFKDCAGLLFSGLVNLETCLQECDGSEDSFKKKIAALCDAGYSQDIAFAFKYLKVDTELICFLMLHLASKLYCPEVCNGSSGVSTSRCDAGEFCIKAEAIKEAFADYVGEVPEAVAQLMAYLKDPATFIAWGVPCVNGILFEGPPGTGKTLLARILAHEAGCPFFYIAASQIQKKYLGESEELIKRLFDDARAAATDAKRPAIVFIDEIDAMGIRPTDDSACALTHRSVFNQLLTEMDGFSTKDGKNVIVIAATNRADMLDDALKRSGRFDAHITFGLPDAKVRALLFKKKVEKIKLREDVGSSTGITTLDELCAELAGMTEGFSPADINNCVDQAKRSAACAHEPLPVAVETLGTYLKSAVEKVRTQTAESAKMSESARAMFG